MKVRKGDVCLDMQVKAHRQPQRRSERSRRAIAANRNPSAARFMANQPAMGLQLALLGRDASTAEQETVMIDEFVTDIREFSVCYFIMLTYIINIMYFPPLLVILYLGSDVPMKLKVVFLLLLPWSLRWTVINLLV
ncbi:uncharacterized protein LOC110866116 [Helianthus annuus]|uniref:uncharacterized protein LOC110866116 n=1 Tax=Helianthus annuus TaxID=4232 RepID=UPI001653044D|nr:uncharacterized protein LOC110866116 [Helianthus annuus]